MLWSQNHSYAFGVTLVATVATVIGIYFYKKKKSWKKVGNVKKLFFHPVKSMRGIDSDKLLCLKDGMCMSDDSVYDRGFLVIQPDGNMLTARMEPGLVTISVQQEKDFIVLHAPNGTSISVPIPFNSDKVITCRVWGEETCGIDCGDEIAQWLSNYFNSPYRLVYHPRQMPGRSISTKDQKHGPLFANRGNIKYHDQTPCHLLSEASLEDLNSKLDKKITVRSFRSNILIEGCQPYEEDNWTYIRIGGVVFQYVRYCARCLLTTVDPDTGIKDAAGDPLKTLKEYRQCKPEERYIYKTSPLFGVSLAVIKEGVINAGDAVYAC